MGQVPVVRAHQSQQRKEAKKRETTLLHDGAKEQARLARIMSNRRVFALLHASLSTCCPTRVFWTRARALYFLRGWARRSHPTEGEVEVPCPTLVTRTSRSEIVTRMPCSPPRTALHPRWARGRRGEHCVFLLFIFFFWFVSTRPGEMFKMPG